MGRKKADKIYMSASKDNCKIRITVPKLCVYVDPSVTSLSGEKADIFDINPVKQPLHSGSKIFPIGQMIISLVDSGLELGQVLRMLTGELFDKMGLSFMKDVMKFVGDVIQYIGDSFISLLKKFFDINREVRPEILGCVELPLGPYPPPFYTKLHEVPGVISVDQICTKEMLNSSLANITGEKIDPSNNKCVFSSEKGVVNNVIHNSVRISYSRTLPICSSDKDGDKNYEANECVRISGVTPSIVRQNFRDILPACNKAGEKMCVDYKGCFSMTEPPHGCKIPKVGFRVLYTTDVINASIENIANLNPTGFFDSCLPDCGMNYCPATTTSGLGNCCIGAKICQRIWGVDIGDYKDISLKFPPIEKENNKLPLAEIVELNKKKFLALITRNVQNICPEYLQNAKSGVNTDCTGSRVIHEQHPNEICVYDVNNFQKAKLIDCTKRATPPLPIPLKCGDKDVYCSINNHFIPSMGIKLEVKEDNITYSTLGVVQAPNIHVKNENAFNLNLAGFNYSAYVTDSQFKTQQNPGTLWGKYKDDETPDKNDKAVYLGGLEYFNNKYIVGGDYICATTGVDSEKCPASMKMCVLAKLYNPTGVDCVKVIEKIKDRKLSLCNNQVQDCKELETIEKDVKIYKCRDKLNNASVECYNYGSNKDSGIESKLPICTDASQLNEDRLYPYPSPGTCKEDSLDYPYCLKINENRYFDVKNPSLTCSDHCVDLGGPSSTSVKDLYDVETAQELFMSKINDCDVNQLNQCLDIYKYIYHSNFGVSEIREYPDLSKCKRKIKQCTDQQLKDKKAYLNSQFLPAAAKIVGIVQIDNSICYSEINKECNKLLDRICTKKATVAKYGEVVVIKECDPVSSDVLVTDNVCKVREIEKCGNLWKEDKIIGSIGWVRHAGTGAGLFQDGLIELKKYRKDVVDNDTEGICGKEIKECSKDDKRNCPIDRERNKNGTPTYRKKDSKLVEMQKFRMQDGKDYVVRSCPRYFCFAEATAEVTVKPQPKDGKYGAKYDEAISKLRSKNSLELGLCQPIIKMPKCKEKRENEAIWHAAKPSEHVDGVCVDPKTQVPYPKEEAIKQRLCAFDPSVDIRADVHFDSGQEANPVFAKLDPANSGCRKAQCLSETVNGVMWSGVNINEFSTGACKSSSDILIGSNKRKCVFDKTAKKAVLEPTTASCTFATCKGETINGVVWSSAGIGSKSIASCEKDDYVLSDAGATRECKLIGGKAQFTSAPSINCELEKRVKTFKTYLQYVIVEGKKVDIPSMWTGAGIIWGIGHGSRVTVTRSSVIRRVLNLDVLVQNFKKYKYIKLKVSQVVTDLVLQIGGSVYYLSPGTEKDIDIMSYLKEGRTTGVITITSVQDWKALVRFTKNKDINELKGSFGRWVEHLGNPRRYNDTMAIVDVIGE